MSGYLSRLPLVGAFNGVGAAGPRRLLAITGGGALIVAVIFGVASIQSKEPLVSNPGRLPHVDPLPGGLHSNPQQDKLNLVTNQEHAARAQEVGTSYTPVMAASQPYTPPKASAPPATPSPAAVQQASPAVPSPYSPPAPAAPVRSIAVAATPASPVAASAVQGQTRTQEDAGFKVALDKMMAGWGGRPPRTDVVIPPEEAAAAEAGPPGTSTLPQNRRRLAGSGEALPDPPTATPVASSSAVRQRVLVPAGRGVYAHTILAANSDAQSPVVLQADSGPLSGDRMIGAFSRERDRLTIRVSKVIHNGQEIGTEGVVVAPSTMEVGVASSVDQNYLSRFALPAAAAFVQGLGQAIAQSNSTSVLGPLGSVSVQNRLNLSQQVGIGAGVAAAQIGSTLQQSAPKGPTVILDVGSSLGVMFLTSVAANP